MKSKFFQFFALAILSMGFVTCIQTGGPSSGPVDATIDFTQNLQDWDGFGVNYVEVAQTIDYENEPQEYGGFSLLSEVERQEIIDLVFGEDGLKPGIVKMFYDPFQQKEPGGQFDHEMTTKWMRYFVHQGIAKIKEMGGDDISIISTMYGPPAWATKQKILRGRDLDPKQYENLAKYMIAWGKFLVEDEKLPLKYLSLHNEGDSPNRWPLDGSHGNIGTGKDYNAFWRPTEVAHFLAFMPPMMKEAGLDVGLTPGECTNWGKFKNMLYHWAIYDNEEALNNIALVTSHGFGSESSIISEPNDLLRIKRPDLHSWTTSMTWGKKNMTDYDFVDLIRMNIYNAKVNAVIPWACIQTLTWVGGDPNPGTCFFVNEDGDYQVKPQYYYYKQMTRAGQNGMAVASVEVDKESDVKLFAFSSNGTDNPDAFLVLNKAYTPVKVNLTVTGGANGYKVFRTTAEEQYVALDDIISSGGKLSYDAPSGSFTTFFAIQ